MNVGVAEAGDDEKGSIVYNVVLLGTTAGVPKD